MKTGVLEVLGESRLERPAQIAAALGANARIKYILSLLQLAIAHADHPEQAAATLQRERLVAGLDDAGLDAVIGAARREGAGYRVPGVGQLLARLAEDIRVMAAPVVAGGAAWAGARLEGVLAAVPAAPDDVVEGAAVLALARAGQVGAGQAGTDSLHQLVMDLHKALNAIQAELAEERLDGAAVYGLAAEDRPRVAAFMAGVQRTRGLKFDHPGLETTAMRAEERLVIQNDIGTTDAHVVVIQVAAAEVTVTYSDLHPERSQFLRQMLAGFDVAWGGEESRRTPGLAEGERFVVSTGQFVAADEAALRAYLEFLGSRLVFLIDWNRARKQLRSFLRPGQRRALLLWAAENGVGHRGFLELGGARLVNDAIETAAGAAIHFGDRLCDVLGDAAAMDFFRFVLRAASEGLREKHSFGLIRDRVRADLAARFRDEVAHLLDLAGDHAGMIFEIAMAVQDGVSGLRTPGGVEGALGRRARGFEHEADQIVVAVREAVARHGDHAAMLSLLEIADDAADHLEEAGFLLELLLGGPAEGVPVGALELLAELVLEAAQEWMKTLAHMRHVGHDAGSLPGTQADIDDFLTAVDRIAELEHAADEAERALTRAAIARAPDFRALHLITHVGSGLEAAADSLKHASLAAREQVLNHVLRR